MKYFLFFLLIPFFLLCSEQEQMARLQALSVMRDHALAMQEAQKALTLYPSSESIHLTAVKIFADAGSEEQMMGCFRKFQQLDVLDLYPRDTLEGMAWGIIEKGTQGSAPLTRAIALIAAAIGNDARGVDILLKNSTDSHKAIRALVVEFSSHFRDAGLQEMIKERLSLEQDGVVRIALLKAVGAMKIQELECQLLAVLENERSLAEEKSAAIGSLLKLKTFVDIEEIEKLIQSPRAALRVLAAELIEVHNKKEEAFLLLPMLRDSHAEVRKASLETLGSLRVKDVKGVQVPDLIAHLLIDSSSEVSITAAWVLMLYHPELGQKSMLRWLNSPQKEERLYAVAALRGAGRYGYPLNLNVFKETNDPYIKMNLGITLIQEQIDPKLGSEALYHVIMNHKERIMECDYGRFQAMAPCDVSHRADVPNYPEAVNQITRLEMLNLLAIQRHPGVKDATFHFLKERPWGVTGAASALLLTEGDEEALVSIRELLSDPSDKVQLQAALILALWGNDPEAIATLQKLYFQVTQAKKEQIIEAIGKIGDFDTLPFLVDRLEETRQILRTISAAAILQILYH